MSADTATLEDLGRELGERIADTEEYRRFEEARADVENDPDAQAMIEEFETLRQEFMLARERGEADRESLREVQEKQRELHSMPVMEEYLRAQDRLQNRLESLNEAISEPLAVDFGGEAGGCCHD